jgi:hypothetical protein
VSFKEKSHDHCVLYYHVEDDHTQQKKEEIINETFSVDLPSGVGGRVGSGVGTA